ncbi:hypothetical protein AvCA_44370 [Azotobacter vinelandii CA]|uniref:Uncharacterized protein n=2 Tax=Azotobacter vinelandii TaxID=354 RepID=C1DGQ9_AZOVD|nr:hypothetical protein [Azotobacter vinelandii]ACO80555.1 Conserved hypothetical protein [Azotobacter vinelandii DJ]AGK14355.1 hypothetical protein AvCA_44370 [Azotobacter vinelandii CA]AGK22005.1 hypothetical protein AvCA6_44370 [Azotobacter vinelandii CA6]SFX37044.1 matrix Mmp37 [Azotobacter vinelandii]GLK58599.1 hypothetical protein GCM10017624_07560 [Azotobacter vinelandii]
MPIPDTQLLPAPPPALLAEVASQCALPVGEELQPLVAEVHTRFDDALVALLFYGSCLRGGDPGEGLVDLYAIVDDYSRAHPRALLRLANAWLPPNVLLLRTHAADGRILQAKCAVLSLDDLERGTALWFQSYLWGRFAQPARLIHCRDAPTERRVQAALARAVLTLLERTLPCLEARFDSETLWQRALTLSYSCELRPEAADRPALLVRHDREHYRRLTGAAAPALAGLEAVAGETDLYCNRLSAAACRQGRRRWRLRRLQGRLLNVVRLVKASFTFEQGVDYVVWKLQRHLGQPIEVSPRLRRHPLIFGWPLLWRLLRERRLR